MQCTKGHDCAATIAGMTTLAALNGAVVKCPKCGTEVTMPSHGERQDDSAFYVVVTDPGTFHRHLRDAHPEEWARVCEMQRKVNANPFIGGMPRKVNGTFLRAGEDVGDLL